MKNKKVYLLMLPFWTPLIPPLGISCLKTHLEQKGHLVRTFDGNVNLELWETHTAYFTCLKKMIPLDKRGNLYNTGMSVLKDHQMGYFNNNDDDFYNELIKEIVWQHFFVHINEEDVEALDKIIKNFFAKLGQYLDKLLNEGIPDVVGISVYSGTLASSLYAFKRIKETYPQVLTVMGGGIFSNDLCLDSENQKAFSEKYAYIDKILIGEGELLFSKLLENQLSSHKKIYSHFDINKEYYELKNAGIPDFSDLQIEKYPYIASYTSRSCPYQCNFCTETIQWGKYRKKSINQIVGELKELYETYKRQLFLFGDSILNPIMNALSEELEHYQTSIYWDGYLRADESVTKDNAFLWRRGGFYRARIGAESGSQRVLNLMNKKTTVEMIKESITNLSYAGIKTTTYWVIGYPGETEEDFQETLNLIRCLKDDIYEADCNPFNYYLDGQVASKALRKNGEVKTLYTDNYNDFLTIKTYILNTLPNREEIYSRVCRFVAFCREIGVPNPYNLADIYEADIRWKRLNKNAVPSLLAFNQNEFMIQENKTIKKPELAKCQVPDEDDFSFNTCYFK